MLVFGVSSVESLGEAVLKSSPWWAAGGRPHGSFFFSFVCVEEDGGWWRGGGVEHRLARDESGVSGSRPLFTPLLRTCYGSSPVACSSRLTRGSGEGVVVGG